MLRQLPRAPGRRARMSKENFIQFVFYPMEKLPLILLVDDEPADNYAHACFMNWGGRGDTRHHQWASGHRLAVA